MSFTLIIARAVAYSLAACNFLAVAGPPNPQPTAEGAAVAGLEMFGRNVIQNPNVAAYGIPAGANFSDLSLGEKLAPLFLSQTVVSNYTAGTPLSNVLVRAENCLFPVRYKGTNVVFLEVYRQSNGFLPATFGYRPLMLAWNRVVAAWPAPRYHPEMVVVEARLGYLFTVPESSRINMTPLRGEVVSNNAGQEIPQVQDTKLQPAAEVIPTQVPMSGGMGVPEKN
jgi:hypothetical protein